MSKPIARNLLYIYAKRLGWNARILEFNRLPPLVKGLSRPRDARKIEEKCVSLIIREIQFYKVSSSELDELEVDSSEQNIKFSKNSKGPSADNSVKGR